jgi:AcrR family transcriptional regulator
MDSTFRRARQPEQKEQRRAHLLATAREQLAGGSGLRALSLNELARRAEMAKANVYRYFETREALLLALLWEEWQRWFAELQSTWPKGKRSPTTPRDVATILARSLAREPLLCELTAALPTVLEQNLGEETIHAFKLASLEFFASIASFLAERAPALTEAAYAELLHDAAHTIMGLYPSLHPTPMAERALADPALRFFRRDFGVEFERVLGALADDHARRSDDRNVTKRARNAKSSARA